MVQRAKSLPELHARMHRMPGGCDWWKCHNYKRNGTLLINAEAFLGIHLRTVGLGCEDVSASRDFRPPTPMCQPVGGTRIDLCRSS